MLAKKNMYYQERIKKLNLFSLSHRRGHLTLLGVNFFGFTKSREWIFFLKMAEN